MLQRKLVIITGTIVLMFGILFYLQGLAVVGPKSSFMYSNPQWINYGAQIIIAGISILVGGIFLIFIIKKATTKK
jgi:hypothetical protein